MVWRWSKTASSNATADSSINWAEGMAPSAVNDSARAEMARVAQWRDDISATIATGGSSTAYTVASNQSFDTLAHLDKAIISFVPHTTSGAAPTLSVDGLTAKKIRFQTGVDLVEGCLIAGTPYIATYYNTAGEFLLYNVAGNPYSVPLGAGMDYWGSSTPSSAFAFPLGQAINRTTYATLFSVIGTTYGVGNGSTTFNLPNKGERVSVMKAGSASLITNAVSGVDSTTLGATGGAESVTLDSTMIPSHTHTASVTDTGHRHTWAGAGGSPSILTDNSAGNLGSGNTGGGLGYRSQISGYPMDTATTGISVSNSSTGGGGAHRNLPPLIVCNYIIRVL